MSSRSTNSSSFMVATRLGQNQTYERLPDDHNDFAAWKLEFLTRCATQGINNILTGDWDLMTEPEDDDEAELKVRFREENQQLQNLFAVGWQILVEICKPKYTHLLTAKEDDDLDERCQHAWEHIVAWFEGQDDVATRQRRIFEQALVLKVKETGDPKQDWAVFKNQIDVLMPNYAWLSSLTTTYSRLKRR